MGPIYFYLLYSEKFVLNKLRGLEQYKEPCIFMPSLIQCVTLERLLDFPLCYAQKLLAEFGEFL